VNSTTPLAATWKGTEKERKKESKKRREIKEEEKNWIRKRNRD
jgi:hypothetical protein